MALAAEVQQPRPVRASTIISLFTKRHPHDAHRCDEIDDVQTRLHDRVHAVLKAPRVGCSKDQDAKGQKSASTKTSRSSSSCSTRDSHGFCKVLVRMPKETKTIDIDLRDTLG